MPHKTSDYRSEPIRSDWLRRDLARFGPNAPQKASLSMDEASRYCRDLAASHYENFSKASFLIPSSMRRHFAHVYAFCRWSDDLADEVASCDEALSLLSWWSDELDGCFRGETPRHPVMIALSETRQEFLLEHKDFSDLVSAFQQDQKVTRYADDAELSDYCNRSANPVGRILLTLAQSRTKQAVELSDAICTGLQLVNFCQDMSVDAEKDRIYLPKSRWHRFAVTEAAILQKQATPELMQSNLDWCRSIAPHFYRGWSLTELVPRWLARDIVLFASGGTALLEKIVRLGGDVWTERPTVSKLDKLRLLARSLLTRRPPTFLVKLVTTQKLE